jgi:ABC-type phosphate transport system auxiliary subunit
MNKDDLIQLIENSEALRRDGEEQAYWLIMAESMDESGRARLGAILTKEADQRLAIVEKLEGRLDEIDEKHIAELKAFNQIELPKFVKKWEAAARTKENPDELLKKL